MSGEGRRLQDVSAPRSDTSYTPTEYAISVQYSQSVPIAVIDRVESLKELNFAPSNEADIVQAQLSQVAQVSQPPPHNLSQLFERDHGRFSILLKRYPENLLGSLSREPRRRRIRKRLAQGMIILLGCLAITQTIIPLPRALGRTGAMMQQQATRGWNAIESGQQLLADRQFTQARSQFAYATEAFHQSLTILKETGQQSSLLPFLVDSSTYSTAQALLTAASGLSDAAGDGVTLAENLHAVMATNHTETSTDPFQKVSTVLQKLLDQNDQNKQLAQRIHDALENADRELVSYATHPVANASLEQARQKAWGMIPRMLSAATVSVDLFNNLPSLLGQDRNRRYLILFLNNTELRPGGGFIGSFATAVLKKGQVDGFSVETNIYKRDNTFGKVSHVDAPYPITQLTKDWYMRDSNWDVDYAASAKQTAWFFKQEGGTDVDGVLSIDTTMLQELLKQTGPITIPNQNVTLNSDNVVSTLEYKSEKEYLDNPDINALNEPKKVIADAFPYLLSALFSKTESDPSVLLSLLSSMTKQKHLLLTALFPEGNNALARTHLDSPIPDQGDFLLISNGNLGGLKSSLHMKQDVQIALEPSDHHTLIHKVVITRTHQGSTAWPDGDNHNFTRVVIPKDALYVTSSSDGVESNVIEPEASFEQFDRYQTIGRWLTTPVGQTRTASFTYETPLPKLLLTTPLYTFSYIKQPGWTEDDLSLTFHNGSDYQFNIPEPSFHSIVTEDISWRVPITHLTH